MPAPSAQLERNTTPRCRWCGEPLHPHLTTAWTVVPFECHPCRRLRTAATDLRKLAERIIHGSDSYALEAAVGRLTDLCLERGL
jgi:hypothetical protein